MADLADPGGGPRVLAAGEGLTVGDPEAVRDRFMIDGRDADGRFALVQHLFGPKALAAPMHRHHREDEYTYVLEGRIGAVLGGQEVFAGPGDLIFKPRNQWHTFWNAGERTGFCAGTHLSGRLRAVLPGTRHHDRALGPGSVG